MCNDDVQKMMTERCWLRRGACGCVRSHRIRSLLAEALGLESRFCGEGRGSAARLDRRLKRRRWRQVKVKRRR